MTGTVFDVQRFSIHDGPGIRTTVFLKGCSLRCLWCHNPESQSPRRELMFYKDKCVGCGECARVCEKAFSRPCEARGACVKVCRRGAREITGRDETAESVVSTVLRDRAYYKTSGGGVTLSGGEPLLQPDFSREILELCKAEGLHTAVETAGNAPFAALEALLPEVDLFLYDIKGIDPETHERNTGARNSLILENAEALMRTGKEVLFRMPYVPGYNDGEAPEVARFVKELGGKLELMAYHSVGAGKYAALGRDYPLSGVTPPSPDEMRRVAGRLGAKYEWSGV